MCLTNWAMAGEYTACRAAQPPAIDGRIDDPTWAKVPWAYGFRDLFQKYTFSAKQTAFKIAYDARFLYVAVRCCEPEMPKVKTGERAFDGWPTHLDDVYFIYSNRYNAEGTWADSPFKILQLGAGGIHRAHGLKGVIAGPLEWKTAYHADDRNWFVESAVPLEFLELDPAKGGFFNMVRHFQTVLGSRRQRSSSWTVVTSSKLDQHTLCPPAFQPSARGWRTWRPQKPSSAAASPTTDGGWA